MKTTQKLLALFLAVLIAFSVCMTPVSAASKVDPSEGFSAMLQSKLYIGLEYALDGLLRVIDVFSPGEDANYPKKDDYKTEYYYPGESAFASATEQAKWSVGYGENSLLDGLDVTNGEYYLAGSLSLGLMFNGRPVAKVADDQRVRAYAISDGESGTAVFAVLDGFGICRGDVQRVRKQFADFAEKNNVISVNVSVLHQHSCIDTLGLGVKIIPAILNNYFVHLLHLDSSRLMRKNQTFMDNLYVKTADAMRQAVSSMQTGDLYYGAVNAKDYIHDKRTPIVFDENLNRLRFVPDDESAKETWICSAGIHCTAFASDTLLTADFPYYIEQEVKDTANLVYANGAQLALTSEKSLTTKEGMTGIDSVAAYGKRLGELLKSITDEEKLDPCLNIASTEFFVDVDNPIHTAAARQGILTSVVVKLPWRRYQLVSEIGYMELGDKLGIVLTPGELTPEMLYGGAETAEQSWFGKSWDYAPWAETAGCEKLLCMGLCNDEVGYILPDNEYRSLFTENEEVNIAGRTSGAAVTEAFEALIESVK